VNEFAEDRPAKPQGIKTFPAENEELLELAQEAGRLGLFEWRVPDGTVSLSPKFLSLYGLVAFDGRYESWLKCIFREDIARIGYLYEDAFATQTREMYAEFRIVEPGGALRWMEARSIIFYDDRGGPLRVVGINVDVTERKRADAQLRAFTETLEARVKERTPRIGSREPGPHQGRSGVAASSQDGGNRPAHRRGRA
jgi:PAS domain S-box-containing protein